MVPPVEMNVGLAGKYVDAVAKDMGVKLTRSQTISADLAAPHSKQNDPIHFGRVSFTQRLVIDLTQEVPLVTDYKLSQTIE